MHATVPIYNVCRDTYREILKMNKTFQKHYDVAK